MTRISVGLFGFGKTGKLVANEFIKDDRFELKWVVKQIFSGDSQTRPLLAELDTWDCDIDRMALAAFDLYMECREQLYRNRIQELKSGRAFLTDAACPSALMREETAGIRGSDCTS